MNSTPQASPSNETTFTDLPPADRMNSPQRAMSRNATQSNPCPDVEAQPEMNYPMKSQRDVFKDTPLLADSRRRKIKNGYATRFTLKQSDVGTNFALHGIATKDIPSIMREHGSREQIDSHDQCSSEIIDHWCIEHFQLLLRGTALDAYSHLIVGTPERRIETQLKHLGEQGKDVQTRPPECWNESVDVYTNLYPPPNRIAILARATVELRYTKGQTKHSSALEVAKAHSRFHAEAARATPKDRGPDTFARKVSHAAAFGTCLPPHIWLETITEDLTDSPQIARGRAKKHETNDLRGSALDNYAPVPRVSSVIKSATATLAETVADLDKQSNKPLKGKNR